MDESIHKVGGSLWEPEGAVCPILSRELRCPIGSTQCCCRLSLRQLLCHHPFFLRVLPGPSTRLRETAAVWVK